MILFFNPFFTILNHQLTISDRDLRYNYLSISINHKTHYITLHHSAHEIAAKLLKWFERPQLNVKVTVVCALHICFALEIRLCIEPVITLLLSVSVLVSSFVTN